MASSVEKDSLFSRIINDGKVASGQSEHSGTSGMVDSTEEAPRPTVDPTLRAQILGLGLRWQLDGTPWGTKGDMSKGLAAECGEDVESERCFDAMGILASEMTMKSAWGGPSTEGPYIKVPADVPGEPFERYFSITSKGASVATQTLIPDQAV